MSRVALFASCGVLEGEVVDEEQSDESHPGCCRGGTLESLFVLRRPERSASDFFSISSFEPYPSF